MALPFYSILYFKQIFAQMSLLVSVVNTALRWTYLTCYQMSLLQHTCLSECLLVCLQVHSVKEQDIFIKQVNG